LQHATLRPRRKKLIPVLQPLDNQLVGTFIRLSPPAIQLHGLPPAPGYRSRLRQLTIVLGLLSAAEAVTFLGNHVAHFQAMEQSNPIEP
jgi:hypothetical protein